MSPSPNATAAQSSAPDRWRLLYDGGAYQRANIIATFLAVFALPVAGLAAHLHHEITGAPLLAWPMEVAWGIEWAVTVFFVLDTVLGVRIQGWSFLRRPLGVVNLLAIGTMGAEAFAADLGLGNPRVLRAVRTVRAVARVGIMLRMRRGASVLGTEMLEKMNEADAWLVLGLMGLMIGLGEFSGGHYTSSLDALHELLIYAALVALIRWKAGQNRRKVERHLGEKLQVATESVLARMRDIPGLEDSDCLIENHAASEEQNGHRLNELDVMVDGLSLVIANMRRFISQRAFEEAKGRVILPADQPVAILFSDMEGFSSISRTLRQQIIPILQKYFTELTRGVIEHHGDVDKFIGDAVFAYFHDARPPQSAADQGFDAMRAMAEMAEALQRLDGEWRAIFEKGGPSLPRLPVRTRFGLHWGTVVAGPVGSALRCDSTLIGDTVNVASRLEALNKRYGTFFLLSGSLVDQLSVERRTLCRHIDRVAVAGRASAPLDIYTLDMPEKGLPSAFFSLYRQALALYLGGDWQQAHGKFCQARACLAAAGLAADGPTEAMIVRIEETNAYWCKALAHLQERAPDLVSRDLADRLTARLRTEPYAAPKDWPGYWQHGK